MRSLLDPHGKATVLLLSAHFRSDLPTIAQLKEALKVRDCRYYKLYSKEGKQFEFLEQAYRTHLYMVNPKNTDWNAGVTDYLLLSGHVHTHDFISVKFHATLIGGYWLTQAVIDEIESIMSNRSQIDIQRRHVQNLRTQLAEGVDLAKAIGVDDPTMGLSTREEVERLLKGYADEAGQQLDQALIDWVQSNKWQMRPPKARRIQSDDESPLPLGESSTDPQVAAHV
ncbi:MAG: hypothetical protein EBZ03_12105 [Betaproteobacteria bacterium]|nr:hypothetical protein [Betaproteobacteria bacterium]NBQ82547.1 hypothetical protein [Betaproteobacteria bacterium]NBT66060.1 hypothetical protein [Betaproteobacteria bacterium]NBU02637.1 hypothetical protein [Betaproteobacteria bacterium]NBU67970.1 hypothetical protein [Betaproteobacteria bacterium]